jgi:large subunit ribosomal protein L15
MPLHRRIPKRGFHSRNRVEYQVVNVGDLEGLSGVVTPEVLRDAGLVGSLRKPIKVLGNGSLDAALQVSAHAFSGSAKAKIEAAGGTATVPARDSDEQA